MARKCIPIEPYIEKLTTALLSGATYKLAALYAGISPKTFERWRQRAETARPGTALAQLQLRLEQAEGQAALRWVAEITRAAQQDWRAAAFMLERRYPDEFGRKAQLDMRLTVQQAAERVAQDLGMSAETILLEAQSLLKEIDHGES